MLLRILLGWAMSYLWLVSLVGLYILGRDFEPLLFGQLMVVNLAFFLPLVGLPFLLLAIVVSLFSRGLSRKVSFASVALLHLLVGGFMLLHSGLLNAFRDALTLILVVLLCLSSSLLFWLIAFGNVGRIRTKH